jgi:hypothetical protein
MTTRKPLRAGRAAGRSFEAASCIDFDAALEAYRDGDDPGALLRAAGVVIDSNLLIGAEHADTISTLIDRLDVEIETYGDAAHAIRHWFFQMREPGARR